MLEDLSIKDFALIDNASVEFKDSARIFPSFNVSSALINFEESEKYSKRPNILNRIEILL